MIPEKVQLKVKEISRVNLSSQTRQSLVNDIRKRDESQRREAGRRSNHNANPTRIPGCEQCRGTEERAGKFQRTLSLNQDLFHLTATFSAEKLQVIVPIY